MRGRGSRCTTALLWALVSATVAASPPADCRTSPRSGEVRGLLAVAASECEHEGQQFAQANCQRALRGASAPDLLHERLENGLTVSILADAN
ncbi:MAG: hypothetical protein OXS50_02505, partial [Gammaproteobacteria bacterium]|nr:hypothetical protein [Gammaproteobacteria bacterium]